MLSAEGKGLETQPTPNSYQTFLFSVDNETQSELPIISFLYIYIFKNPKNTGDGGYRENTASKKSERLRNEKVSIMSMFLLSLMV